MICLQVADKATGIPPVLYTRMQFPEGHQQVWGCPAQPLLVGTVLVEVRDCNKSGCKGQRRTQCFSELQLLMLTCSRCGNLIHCLDPSHETGRQFVVETPVWIQICATIKTFHKTP